MKKTLLSLIFLILTGCATHNSANNTIYQVSTLDALIKGQYEAFVEFSELKEHGDFGLGTFDSLDGEMIAIDGKFYQIKSDGVVYPVSLNTKTPFADMIFFNADTLFDINKETSCEDVIAEISKRLSSWSIFYAIRVDGIFEKVKIRSVPAQKKPYPGLLEAVKGQTVFDYENVNGTILGFWFPEFMKGAGITGFHFHFISDDRAKGGHLLTCKLKKAVVKIDYSTRLFLKLPENGQYPNQTKDNLTPSAVSYH